MFAIPAHQTQCARVTRRCAGLSHGGLDGRLTARCSGTSETSRRRLSDRSSAMTVSWSCSDRTTRGSVKTQKRSVSTASSTSRPTSSGCMPRDTTSSRTLSASLSPFAGAQIGHLTASGPPARHAVGADVRVHGARAQHRCVQRRLRRSKLPLEGRHERDHPVLGDVVGARRPTGNQPGDRRGRVDVPFALLLDEREERLHAIDRSPKVDAEHPLPVVDRCLAHRGEGPDPGVVAKHVDRAEPVERRLGECFDVGQPRHVRGHTHDLAACRLQGTDRLHEVRLTDVGQHDLHARGRERPSDPETDARRGAGDDRDLPLD